MAITDENPLGFCTCGMAKIRVEEGGVKRVICPDCGTRDETIRGPIVSGTDDPNDFVLAVNPLGYREQLLKGSPVPAGYRVVTSEAEAAQVIAAMGGPWPTATAPERPAPPARSVRPATPAAPAPVAAAKAAVPQQVPLGGWVSVTAEFPADILRALIEVIESDTTPRSVKEARRLIELSDVLKEAHDSIK
jgi:hypothetical protein